MFWNGSCVNLRVCQFYWTPLYGHSRQIFSLSPFPSAFYILARIWEIEAPWWSNYLMGPFYVGKIWGTFLFSATGNAFFLAFFWLMIAAEQSTLLLFRQLFLFCGNLSWIFPDTDETWRLFVTGKIRILRKRDQRKKTLQGGWTENTLLSVPNKFNSLCSPTGKDTSGKNRQPLQPFNSHGGWNGKKVF